MDVFYRDPESGEVVQALTGTDLEALLKEKGYDLVEPGATQEPAPLPAKSAPKDEWVGVAVERGADPDEAQHATKAELIAQYGSDQPAG